MFLHLKTFFFKLSYQGSTKKVRTVSDPNMCIIIYKKNGLWKLFAGAKISNFVFHPAQGLIWLIIFFFPLGPDTK